MKGIVIGDVGGHGDQLFATLKSLGVNLKTGVIPKDLTIISLGDLIHKGPKSEDIIDFVDKVFKKNPDNWMQLLGNHEMQHLEGYLFWDCNCSIELVDCLINWRVNNFATSAGVLKHKPIPGMLDSQYSLLTHAGVTHDVFKNVTSGKRVNDVFWGLEKLYVNDFKEMNKPGVMLGSPVTKTAGVFWAHSTIEVYPSWFEHEMPFNQIHGHTAPYAWENNNWFPGTGAFWRENLTVHSMQRSVSFKPNVMSDGNFLALDPGFELKVPSIDTIPYTVLEDLEFLV